MERSVEDPYGTRTVLTPSFGPRSATPYDWKYYHQGLRLDASGTLYDNRARMYSPTLMRFLQNDPLGFGAGDPNTYRYEGNGPTGGSDPGGLQDGPSPQPNNNRSELRIYYVPTYEIVPSSAPWNWIIRKDSTRSAFDIFRRGFQFDSLASGASVGEAALGQSLDSGLFARRYWPASDRFLGSADHFGKRWVKIPQ
jgi:RHS repeat-associated protein